MFRTSKKFCIFGVKTNKDSFDKVVSIPEKILLPKSKTRSLIGGFGWPGAPSSQNQFEIPAQNKVFNLRA